MNDIEKLVAENTIKKQLANYCKGVDTKDWSLVRSCFGDNHEHQHGQFNGSLDEFVSFASSNMTHVSMSQHSLSNFIITINDDGLSAKSEVSFHAVHLIDASVTADLFFNIQGQDNDWIVLGSYVDQWTFKDGQWLIIKRNARHNWERIEPSKGR